MVRAALEVQAVDSTKVSILLGRDFYNSRPNSSTAALSCSRA